MENSALGEEFWTSLYKEEDIGWDLGKVSPPIASYFDQLKDKSPKILIPGGGNSYEAEHLFRSGFSNTFVVDIAHIPLENLKKRCPEFPNDQLIHRNFFDLDDSFDIIVEQTFFCAIHPSLRIKYVNHCYNLLNNKGRIIGLLFNVPLNQDHPPYGGSQSEYLNLFQNLFNIKVMDIAWNSIEPRSGNELFIHLVKK